MKKFVEPDVEVVDLEVEDVVNLSEGEVEIPGVAGDFTQEYDK